MLGPRIGTAAAVATLAVSAAAAGAEPSTLATSTKPSAVSAYRDVVAFSAYDPETRRFALTVREGESTRVLPVAPRRSEFDATVSRGPDGRPLVVYARCDRGCGIYGIVARGGRERPLVRGRAAVESPALWGRRLAWIEGKRVRTATIGGRVRAVPVPRRGAVHELALLGGRLALAASAPSAGVGHGREQVWLQQLDGSRRRLVRQIAVGEGGQSLQGLSFRGGALYYVKSCFGDPAGCLGRNAFRYRNGRSASANVPETLSGFAMTGDTAYWMTAGIDGECLDYSDGSERQICRLQRARPRFNAVSAGGPSRTRR